MKTNSFQISEVFDTATFIMKVIIAILFLLCLIHHCQSECPQRFTSALYPANNRALLNHVFQWKTVSSPVICGRDCSMDPQCASFNYHAIKHICVLNNATRAHNPADFIELKQSAYYDDNLENPLLSVPDTVRYSSCQILFKAGYRKNGIYTISPAGLTNEIQVSCDMETDGGGWIVFQKRQDGSVDFYRNWTEYKSGFGDLSDEFWIGNDILRNLTGSGQWQLRVDMEDWENQTAWSAYGQFAVSYDNYTLHVGSYDAESTAGDSMANHNGHPFTTKDQDNDAKSVNCAVRYEGAWWFHQCHHAHLNGKYYHHGDVPFGQGIQWYTWKGYYYSLKKCSMKIRQVL